WVLRPERAARLRPHRRLTRAAQCDTEQGDGEQRCGTRPDVATSAIEHGPPQDWSPRLTSVAVLNIWRRLPVKSRGSARPCSSAGERGMSSGGGAEPSGEA